MKRSQTHIITLLILCGLIIGQENQSSAWTELANTDSLNIEFLFYSEADNYNNGVVLKLRNDNPEKIRYNFELIFRSANEDSSITVDGFLTAGETKAGSNDSLFWIPYKDKRQIHEVGITKIRVIKLSIQNAR